MQELEQFSELLPTVYEGATSAWVWLDMLASGSKDAGRDRIDHGIRVRCAEHISAAWLRKNNN